MNSHHESQTEKGAPISPDFPDTSLEPVPDVSKHSSVTARPSESNDLVTESNVQPTKSQTLRWPVWTIIVLSILSSTFLFALDNTIVADVQPRIIDSLGEIQKLPWISVAFALGAVSVNLVW